MAELKDRLRADLNDAMRSRDQVRLRTLRMALTSITNEEVAGASARDLSDEEIVKVLTREARKRREAAEAFGAAGRAEQAAAERAEGDVLAGYLPAQLGDDELAELVAAAIAETGATGMKSMGQVMKTLTLMSTVMLPPSSRTYCALSYTPTPMPAALVVWKGLNSRSRTNSGVMPTPLSVIVNEASAHRDEPFALQAQRTQPRGEQR